MTQALPENTQSQVKTLLLELQQDVADYRRLEGILLEQKTLLIQHDSDGLQQLNQKQEPLLAQLAQRAASDRKSTRLNSSHLKLSRMPSSA